MPPNSLSIQCVCHVEPFDDGCLRKFCTYLESTRRKKNRSNSFNSRSIECSLDWLSLLLTFCSLDFRSNSDAFDRDRTGTKIQGTKWNNNHGQSPLDGTWIEWIRTTLFSVWRCSQKKIFALSLSTCHDCFGKHDLFSFWHQFCWMLVLCKITSLQSFLAILLGRHHRRTSWTN